MSAFIGRVELTPVAMKNGARWYELLSNFEFQSDEVGRTITVPKGFLTDLASVPLVLQPIIQKDEGLLEAAVIHDFLYSKTANCYHLTRKQADRVFLEAMTHAGMGAVKRGLAYNMVRTFAAKSYKKR